MFSSPTKLGLQASIAAHESASQIQQLKSIGNQPRVGILSPNVIADTGARSISTPGHVENVRVRVTQVSDVSSRVTVTFKRDPNDSFFSHALVHVSGYKGNPAPTQLASGQSPISFAMENTGEPVAVHVQSNGNLGPAPLVTAPTATMQLRSTPLAGQTTTGGTGITPAAIVVIQAALGVGSNVYPTFSTIAGHCTGGGSPPGRTYASRMCGRLFINRPTSWTFAFSVNGGGVDIANISVVRTAIDSLTIIDRASVTFGGSSTPSLANGINTSDAIAFPIDTGHDFWVIYEVLLSSAGWIDYGRHAPSSPNDYVVEFGDGYSWTGNVTASNPIDLTTGFIGLIGSQLNQVLSL